MVIITVASALPWAVVAVLDAIDGNYRTTEIIIMRLVLSTSCLLLAYTTGMLFIVVLWINIAYYGEDGRYDEVATVLVLLIFNLWHVSRNVRGWLQYIALRKLRPCFEQMQRNLACSAPLMPDEQRDRVLVQELERLRISDRLIDNDWNRNTPFLSPFYRLKGGVPPVSQQGHRSQLSRKHRADDVVQSPRNDFAWDRTEEVWAVAAWRAWWTQDTSLPDVFVTDLTAPSSLNCNDLQSLADGLLSNGVGPSWPKTRDVVDSCSPGNPKITSAEQWAQCLTTYHCEQGQQDTRGDSLRRVTNFSNASGIAVVVREKTHYPPNRMSSLWYNTATFEEVYEEKRKEVRQMYEVGQLVMPSWSSWLQIASDIGKHQPIYACDTKLINFAGELASASLIMARYPDKYRELVELIYEDGLRARWTFGWSGLLACFSHLWTLERIHIAMLNGLSLLALSKTAEVKDIDESVRSMMYGYAAFAVSDRAVGKKIAQDRKKELLRRYKEDRGRTCRGSGVCATRLACIWLGLPAEASHMDGLPAFSTGWCSEYLERNPGNQKPEHGNSHDDVEMRHGSSNVWRYPYSHT